MEEIYRLIFESLRDGFISVDMQGRLNKFNTAYQRMLGYSEAELHNLTYLNITPEKWHAFEEKIIQEQVVPRGYSDLYEKEYIAKDGRVFPVELITYLIKDEQGKPVGMWAFVRDISERKRADNILKKEKDFVKDVIDNLPGIFYLFNKEGKLVMWNKVFEKITGYPAEEMCKMTEIDFIVDAQKELVSEKVKEVFLNGSASVKANLLTKGKKEVPFYFSGSRIQIEGKEYLAGMGIDVTEQEKASDAFVKSEEKYLDLFENANDMIYAFDLAGNFISYNKAICETLGYSKEEMGKKNILDALSLESRGFALKMLQQAIRDKSDLKELQPWDLVIISKDGKEIASETRTRLIWDKNEVVGVQGISRDITERKKYEDDLKKKIHDLEIFNKISVERELKMIELKKKIEDLEYRLKAKS